MSLIIHNNYVTINNLKIVDCSIDVIIPEWCISVIGQKDGTIEVSGGNFYQQTILKMQITDAGIKSNAPKTFTPGVDCVF